MEIDILFKKTPPELDYYQAAVIEYHPVSEKGGNETFTKNGNIYVEHIKTAAQIADIIVFPESTLVEDWQAVYIKVPDPSEKEVPAKSDVYHPVLRMLSQAAFDNNVYVLVNLAEEVISNGTTLKFNTNVVFDRNGTVIARYRKFHLFNESGKNRTSDPEIAFFDTDFGVRFGTFTCFDILFEEPAKSLLNSGVTDILFPTYWFAELSFMTASQVQSGWSYAHNTNLLAAGANMVMRGTSGSGIYNGRKGPVATLQSRQTDTVILSAKIIKKGKEGTPQDLSNPSSVLVEDKNLNISSDEVQWYATESLLPVYNESDYTRINTEDPNKYEMIRNVSMKNHSICQCNFCCEFDIDMTIIYRSKDYINVSDISYSQQDSLYHFQYRLAAFDGIRNYDRSDTGGQQFCSIISCLNENITSCSSTLNKVTLDDLTWENNRTLALYKTTFNNIYIRSKSFITNSTFLFPNILESSDLLKEFGNVSGINHAEFINYNEGVNETHLKFSSDRLITAGLYSRVFSRDGGPAGPLPCTSASYPLSSSVSLIFFLSLLFIYYNF